MKLAATIAGSIKADLQAEMRRIERAVTSGVRQAGDGLKGSLRRQVVAVGLGARLARTWRGRHYPNKGFDAASLVWSKAPQIVRTFDEGGGHPQQVRLLVGHPDAGGAEAGRGWQAHQPVQLPGAPVRAAPVRLSGRGPSLLVVDGVRASYSRKTGELRGFRKASERARKTGRGLTTVVMFLLVPQVRLPKRLDVPRAAERWSQRLPALIDRHLSVTRSLTREAGTGASAGLEGT